MRTTNLSLEGLRGAAALLVVFYHMRGELPGSSATRAGFLAVDLFFVLSGFVIFVAYGNRVTDSPSWRSFMLRRFGRLFPAHIAATTLYFAILNGFTVVSLALGYQAAHYNFPTLPEALAIMTMSQGLPLFADYVGLQVTWSTSCEFYVYMLFGALCLLLRGRARVIAFATLALGGYGVAVWASIVPYACLVFGKCLSVTYDYGIARCIAGFFMGALIAIFRNGRIISAFTRPLTQILSLVVAGALIDLSDTVYPLALLAPLAFAVLVASLSSDLGPVAYLFSRRAFQWLGGMSYSVYLMHDVFRPLLHGVGPNTTKPSASILIGIVYLAASYVAAHFLHKYIEVPWRKRFYEWADRLRERAPSVAVD